MSWVIEISPSAKKELKNLDKSAYFRIVDFLEKRITPIDDPRSIGEALKGNDLGKFWKYRVGDYRIISKIEDERIVIVVVSIGHRKNVYG